MMTLRMICLIKPEKNYEKKTLYVYERKYLSVFFTSNPQYGIQFKNSEIQYFLIPL